MCIVIIVFNETLLSRKTAILNTYFNMKLILIFVYRKRW
jgi:hypothetical protein